MWLKNNGAVIYKRGVLARGMCLSKGIALVLFMMCFVSCAPVLSGHQFYSVYDDLPQLDKGKARIVMLWPAEKSGGFTGKVTIDDAHTLDLLKSACVYRDVQSGTHKVVLDAEDPYGFGTPGEFRKEYDLKGGEERFLRLRHRKSRTNAGLALGIIGSAIESGVADEGNNGLFEFVDIERAKAFDLMKQCVYQVPNAQ